MPEFMDKGGPMMWLILAASVVAATIFVQRLLYLHRAQIKAGDFLKGIFNVVGKGNLVEAISLCDEAPGPVARMVRVALLQRNQGREQIQQGMEEVGLAEIPRLEKNLLLLLTMAQITPMLGLLGTVLGMLEVLQTIQQKAPLVHAGDLGGGLWQALLTTAAGLVVAIPTYAAYNLLVSRVEALILDMERAFGEVLRFLSQLDQNGGG